MEMKKEKSKPLNVNFKRIDNRTIKEKIRKVEKKIDPVVTNNMRQNNLW